MFQSADLDTRSSVVPAISPLHPVGATAVRVLETWNAPRKFPLVFVAQTVRRARDISEILCALEPKLKLAYLPPWDCLPYDGLSASLSVMGQRMGVLRWLTNSANLPDIVVTTAEGLMRRVPPRSVWKKLHREFRPGDVFEVEEVKPFLEALGYVFDDRVDEPGEAAIRGKVVDFFPAGGQLPCRIEHEKGRITAIRSYDPITQRTISEIEMLIIDPASELVGADPEKTSAASTPEIRLLQVHGDLETVFDYLGESELLIEDGVERRAEAFLQAADEAFRETEDRGERKGRTPSPERFLLGDEEWVGKVRKRLGAVIDDLPDGASSSVGSFSAASQPWDALRDFIEEKGAPLRVVLAANSKLVLNDWQRRARRNLGGTWERAGHWKSVKGAKDGTRWTAILPIKEGFYLADRNILVVCPRDLGGRNAASDDRSAASALMGSTEDYEIGDAVVHLDHGVGILEGLEHLERDGKAHDVLRLRYADDASLIVPMSDVGALWRYGGQTGDLRLDKLKGESWENRRNDLMQRVQKTAAGMVELMRERRQAKAPALRPDRRDYERFCAGFAYELSVDQESAVDAVLADMASGRPMDRLICGDVGFGKTEVGLRAAAVAASAGRQVAIVAPTTVLAQQHTRSAAKRFHALGIEVAHLSRLTSASDAKRIKDGLKSGEIRVVVGTHALCSSTIDFADLGLVVIDEEQRFGTKQKEALRRMAQDRHILTMTATPIPRTLQASFVGLNEISVIATPPTLRRPTRTVLAEFDDNLVRDALMRERRRGGQSFVVCPRVEDIEPMAERLRALVPDLAVAVAHGKLAPDVVDETMFDFSKGRGDVLLATNIIESGLDVPAANTMIVWRPDRFGLAQLHQIRGRVGRGSRRGVVYLLMESGQTLGENTERRLRTLEAMSSLGAGFAISARDLDLRGAGELLGDEQAGHLQLVGLGLYRHLLERALIVAEGRQAPDDWTPDVAIGAIGSIPAEYIPDPAARINLYSRIDQVRERSTLELLIEEITDRFGAIPRETKILLKLAELKLRCRELGLQKLASGPKGTAITFRTRAQADAARKLGCPAGWKWNEAKLVAPIAASKLSERFVAARQVLDTIEPRG